MNAYQICYTAAYGVCTALASSTHSHQHSSLQRRGARAARDCQTSEFEINFVIPWWNRNWYIVFSRGCGTTESQMSPEPPLCLVWGVILGICGVTTMTSNLVSISSFNHGLSCYIKTWLWGYGTKTWAYGLSFCLFDFPGRSFNKAWWAMIKTYIMTWLCGCSVGNDSNFYGSKLN